MIFAALSTAAFVSCSDSDEDSKPAIGITAVTVTPQGSAKSYACDIDQVAMTIENTKDSVDWDVIDASLTKATVKATATLGGTVYYGSETVGADGVEVDATSPVTLTVKDEVGQVKSYTLKVVKATTASGEDMLKKGSTFVGLPANLVHYDMTVFNNKFYAYTVSVDGETENYQLFSSEDGLNWTEVAYKTDATGVNLPEGQSEYVVGGEGARLQVFNGKMYLFGGSRSLGKDKYGNESDAQDFWGMKMISIPGWRSYSTSDGETFKCDTVGATRTNVNGEAKAIYKQYPYSFVNSAVLGSKMFIKSGYLNGFGMWQNATVCAYTTDGKNWTDITVASDDDECDVNRRNGDCFFSFKGKLWCIGGFTNFISANSMCNKIYSSTDGENWKLEGESTTFTNIFNAKAIATENVAYIIGGEVFEGENRTLSNKVYRSVDGITWEEITIPTAFEARRNSSGAVLGNAVWIFGGSNTTTSSNYGYPADDTDVKLSDTWQKLIK